MINVIIGTGQHTLLSDESDWTTREALCAQMLIFVAVKEVSDERSGGCGLVFGQAVI